MPPLPSGAGLSPMERFLYLVVLFSVCVHCRQQLKRSHLTVRHSDELASDVTADAGYREKRSAGSTRNLSKLSCCHVCGSAVAVYQATFISKWNKTTHPHDFPTIPPAQFSAVIGGTHLAEHPLWALGSKASLAVKKFSEWGDARSLLHRIKRHYHGIIKMSAVTQSNMPVTDRFRADNTRHYVSIMSKITPSPDWFVGIDRLDLCDSTSCTWKKNITVELTPIDAGTDSGLKFLGINRKTDPAQLIHRIYPNFPNHPDASFFNRKQTSIPPMAEFKLKLIDTKTRCPRETLRVNCKVSRWSSWTSCSNLCGRGRKQRGRVILVQPKNGGRLCPKTNRSRSCHGRNCPGKADCRVKNWSKWSGCSKTCGKGKRTRKRDVAAFPRGGGNKCPNLLQKAKCRIRKCPVMDCIVSKWTSWTACSKSCGKGKRRRTRKITQVPNKGGAKCPQLREGQSCNVFKCRGKSRLSSIG